MEDQRSSPKHPTILYIVARGHSGSTLLELLLNRNPNIAAMGEVNLLGLQMHRRGQTRWNGLCSCRKSPFECHIWGPVINSVQQEFKIDLKDQPMAFRLSDDNLSEEYGWKRPWQKISYLANRLLRSVQQNYVTLNPISFFRKYKDWTSKRDYLYCRYATQRNVSCVVDASKDYLQIPDIYRHSSLPIKVIYLTRDVRGHVWSAKRRKAANAVKESRDWSKINGKILRTLDLIPKKDWIHIKYEDLCENHSEQLSRIFSFAGIKNETIPPADELQRRHTIAGNRIRFNEIKKIRQDTNWTSNLEDSDLKQIKQLARTVAQELGYHIT